MEWTDAHQSVAAFAVAAQRRMLRALHEEGRVYPPDSLAEDDAYAIDLIATVLLSGVVGIRAWATGAYDQYLTDLPALLALIGSWLDAFEPTVFGIPALGLPVADA